MLLNEFSARILGLRAEYSVKFAHRLGSVERPRPARLIALNRGAVRQGSGPVSEMAPKGTAGDRRLGSRMSHRMFLAKDTTLSSSLAGENGFTM